MKDNKFLAQDQLKELLSYCPKTGVFTWIKSRSGVKINTKAGSRRPDGYFEIGLVGKSYLAHRVAWFFMTGAWPSKEIDHIDGNPSNNAWENLRDISHSENMQNLRAATTRNKSTKLLGVGFHKASGRFQARIHFDGKRKHLGLFDTAEEAYRVYLKAKRKNHKRCKILLDKP